MRRLTTITSLLLLVAMTAFGQDFDTNKLDAYFDTLAKNDRFMGSVAVSKNGELIYTRSVGFLEAGNPKAADDNTKYRIGSISKPFTATLIMKAVAENKLRLDQTIDNYFPTIENAAEITVNQLLNHRSGIANFTSRPDYLEWHTQPKSEEELVAIIAAGGSDFEPDTKASYSNSNYVLLTYLLEKVFAKPYASLLDEYIAQPLGLTNTFVGTAIEPANNEARSYRALDGWAAEPETDMSIPLGAGAVISTPTDIIRFGEALLTGNIIPAESVGPMKTIKDSYGMGLFQMPFHEKQAFGHSGGIDGFHSTWRYFPEERVSFALTSNGTAMNTNDIAVAVLSAVFHKPYDIPVFSNYQLREGEVQQYLGVYASTQLPLKMTITNEGNTLLAQVTGQPSFPLEATAKDKFKFDQAGVVIEFDPVKGLLILKQNGGEFSFTRE
ncbi:serine hydrolase domain-containing protein [Parapedobacter soli]|uniref:serine hydrolase domain-containing protein n=1 Tax=Parapedobacter soli TaxID=416955 RepID=UPI0021C8D190|nr:serine hydrolase domain-containing protein [Parapedobacter soli]